MLIKCYSIFDDGMNNEEGRTADGTAGAKIAQTKVNLVLHYSF